MNSSASAAAKLNVAARDGLQSMKVCVRYHGREKDANANILITLAPWQFCIISEVCYVCVTQSHSIYFLRSLAKKNSGRECKLLLGGLSLLEGKGWCSSSFPQCCGKSALWFHPNALFISLSGGVFNRLFSQNTMLGQIILSCLVWLLLVKATTKDHKWV